MIDLATSRAFTRDDQIRFATLTGDWNPMHVDPVAARRTLAGAPVVHGMHLLLWVLNAAAGQLADLFVPGHVGAAFTRFVHLDDPVRVRAVERDRERCILEVAGEDGARCRIELRRTGARPQAAPRVTSGARYDPATEPRTVNPDGIEGMSGHVPPAASADAMAGLFPGAARLIGKANLAMLGASTRLVGMICPGRHSLYTGLAVDVTRSDGEADALAFEVMRQRHGLINCRIAGGGLVGTVSSLLRAAPVRQPDLSDLNRMVGPDDFRSSRALVIGGSRGLGELTAKLVAAGGGGVAITYHQGQAEAAAIQDQIRRAGGTCDILPYDVGQDAVDQLRPLGGTITHAYFFATPPILKSPTPRFSPERLRYFTRYFVDGFAAFADAMRAQSRSTRLFYPSTTYVDAPPAGLLEYAMAKAAGEVLCTGLGEDRDGGATFSFRFPRLATDQTAGPYGAATETDAAAALLPVIRTVQSRGADDRGDRACPDAV